MEAWFRILLCAFPLLVPGQSHAGEGHRLCAVPELSAAEAARIDVGDGSVEDWIEVVGEPVLTALDRP